MCLGQGQSGITEIRLSPKRCNLFQIDLMHDRNPEVQKLCDATLDIISLHDESWRDRVRREKFRFHNAQWLEIVEGQRAAQVIQVTVLFQYTVKPQIFIRIKIISI